MYESCCLNYQLSKYFANEKGYNSLKIIGSFQSYDEKKNFFFGPHFGLNIRGAGPPGSATALLTDGTICDGNKGFKAFAASKKLRLDFRRSLGGRSAD